MRSRSVVRRLLAVTIAGSIFAVATIASAEPRAAASKKNDCGESAGTPAGELTPDTRYCFVSDPLSAGTEGPGEVILPVRRIAAFSTLIRPRLHFVPELLRSAEQF